MNEHEEEIRKQAEGLIKGIINGTNAYGKAELSIVHFGERYRLVGNPGISESIGQLIRVVEDRKRLEDPVVGIIWFKIPVGSKQNYYLIAFELDHWGDLSHTIYYICGGMTDHSGEGGRAYDAMKFYIERYNDVPTTTIILKGYPVNKFNNSKDLIDYLDKKLIMTRTSRPVKT